ncbi:CiaD-like domain-containing protein [Helicobacter mustelae]|uniref:Campylobacter invasion antigen D C-terminal domain-containing protein n=1 Tax=Helicobacter mustelae (strain ATCC 43772 / CCUG 25715 / CIP 103759 / LMG 18044 / NCTC 12198 / R85-136P) TaxID=679897 RepID=D3UI53_HELM1|nr:hypothetical protein [Helicobacter mustelae]CBG40176.1 Putative hypothetical protein [Helicobacter mustelae 12198]SQH71679.1 Uncharacterised protein [Helicobacter mustelae]STP12804.1 Uncharacterised protein [Helicobacter mustelae]
MELKDIILQTIDEYKNESPRAQDAYPVQESLDFKEDFKKEFKDERGESHEKASKNIEIRIDSRFLELLREKTLVLFEGLQSSQTKDIASKLDLVINYLEYQLSLIDETLQNP